jgi:hypothetical protein
MTVGEDVNRMTVCKDVNRMTFGKDVNPSAWRNEQCSHAACFHSFDNISTTYGSNVIGILCAC